MIQQRLVFLKEFLNSFYTTGAIAPSGKSLARKMVAPLDELPGRRCILEAGPGTGVFTQEILTRLRPGDELLLCEINPRFVEHLRDRFDSDPLWKEKANQVCIECRDIRELLEPSNFDLIVSGLPLNNFSPDFVQALLIQYVQSLKPHGIHTFFEYQAIRTVRRFIASKETRVRMKDIQKAVDSLHKIAEVSRHSVVLNIPPAYTYEIKPHVEDANLHERLEKS